MGWVAVVIIVREIMVGYDEVKRNGLGGVLKTQLLLDPAGCLPALAMTPTAFTDHYSPLCSLKTMSRMSIGKYGKIMRKLITDSDLQSTNILQGSTFSTEISLQEF